MQQKMLVVSVVFYAVFLVNSVNAEEVENSNQTETVTVTATRTERASKDVPAAVSVIDETRLESSRMFNISETLGEEPGVLTKSGSGGYDARMVIRGSGLKANYGIREIMMLRDGIPITDPDSFTRLDFIDTQDIERIEITRGPGNLYAAGSAGGTVQIISKSVFDMSKNISRIAAGSYGTFNAHLRYAADLSQQQAGAVSFSHRRTDNDWRRNNKFDTSQISFKHGMYVGGEDVWENEFSYTDANLQTPGKMNQSQYQEYLRSGKQTDNDNAFKHTGRYSDIWSLTSRMELSRGNYTYTPRFYVNEYSQFHPVTGQIVDTSASLVAGVDLEMQHTHKLAGKDSEFVGGVTYRMDRNTGDERYAYADVVTTPGGRIIETLSNNKGALLEVQNTHNSLYGFFLQESMQLANKLKMDASVRVDRATLQRDGNEMQRYDYASGQYVTGVGAFNIDKDFNLWSPRLGLIYVLSESTNVFVSLAQADQTPFTSELENNPDLDKSTVRNFEVGFKGRAKNWHYDFSTYWAVGKDEVMTTLENGETLFSNAGRTDKKGVELAAAYQVLHDLQLGVNYAFSDYTYDAFTEVVSGVPLDRSGNTLPYVPRHKTTIFLDYKNNHGITARISADTWGSYWVDNANSEKYQGYDLVTNLFVGWEQGQHRLGLNIDNLFDKHYAIQVTKDTRGNLSYVPAVPRSFMLSYRYEFGKES